MNGSSQAVFCASGCHADHSAGTDSFPQQGLLLWISVPMATVWPTWKDFPEADFFKKKKTPRTTMEEPIQSLSAVGAPD